MRIKIIAMGKLSEKYHKELLKEGMENIKKVHGTSTFAEVFHIREEPLANNFSEADIKKALDIEAEKILAKIDAGDFLVCLDIKGKLIKRKVYGELKEMAEKQNKESLVFIVGSSYGISENLKKRANFLLSFGKLTLNHQIVPALLLDVLSCK